MAMLKIAFRNIFRHKARSLITLSTVICGCVALIFVGGYFEDVFYQMREAYIKSQLGHIQIYRRGFTENGRIQPYRYLIENSEKIKAFIEAVPEVKRVGRRLQFSGLISTGENSITFVGEGFEVQAEKMVVYQPKENLREFVKNENLGAPIILSGEGLQESDVYEVMLGKGLGETTRASVNSPVTILTTTVHGATNALDVNVKGFFETARKDFDDIFLRLPLKTAQSLLDTQAVESIVVYLDKTQDTSKVYESLQVLIRDKKLDLEVKRWEDLADFYNKTVRLFNMFYFVMRIVIGIVVILGIYNTMNMSVLERISEIGTVMALGMRTRGVLQLFLAEGLLLGIIGGALGVLVGSGIVGFIASVGIVMPPPPGGTFYWLSRPCVVPSVVVSTFVLAVIVGGISSLFPAYKASRMDIIDALRYR